MSDPNSLHLVGDSDEQTVRVKQLSKRMQVWGAVLTIPYWLSISLLLLGKSAEFYMLLVFPLAIILGSVTSHFVGFWILTNRHSKQFAKKVIWHSYWPMVDDE